MGKKWTWAKAAKYCEDVFGSQLEIEEDEADSFFVCPECGEPLYKADYDKEWDWHYCPVCECEFEELD